MSHPADRIAFIIPQFRMVSAMCPHMACVSAAGLLHSGTPVVALSLQLSSCTAAHAFHICRAVMHNVWRQALDGVHGSEQRLLAHFVAQEQYVNDRDFLLGAAKRAGLPEDQAAALLDDPNAMRAEVHASVCCAIPAAPSHRPSKPLPCSTCALEHQSCIYLSACRRSLRPCCSTKALGVFSGGT
jgi:hypothetical protein